MPLRSRRTRFVLTATLWVLSATCRADHAAVAGADTPKPATAPKSAPTEPSKPTAAPGASSDTTSATDLVGLVAQRDLWPLKADSVADRLRPLGPWKREQPIPEALTLVGGRRGAIERAELSYSSDGKNGWIFVGASFFVRDTDLKRSYDDTAAAVQKQLGKPKWTRKASSGGIPSAGWKLPNRLELLLSKSATEGEQLLALTVSEPQGGSRD